MDNQEKRIHTRVATTIQVHVADDRGAFTEYQAADISKGGLFLLSEELFLLGKQIEMILKLPNHNIEIAVMGEVVRLVGYDKPSEPIPGQPYNTKGVGIRFVVVEPSQRLQLHEFVDNLLSKEGGGSRTHPRVKIQQTIRVVCESRRDNAILKNISLGGMYIGSKTAMEIGTTCELWLRIDSPEPFPVDCQVVHIAPPIKGQEDQEWGIGLKYTRLVPALRKQLTEWIQELMS